MANMIPTALKNAININRREFYWPNQDKQPGALVNDVQRLSQYKRFTHLYHGHYGLAFPTDPVLSSLGPLSSNVNMISRAVDALHSAVWMDIPEVRCRDERMQLFAHELLENNRIEEQISNAVRDTILFGDSVLQVAIVNGKIRIQAINPSLYFPECRQPNPQEPMAHNLIWAEDSDGEWYRRERYWFNRDTGTWFLTVNRFNAATGVESNPLSEDDLRLASSPIIHTYSSRLSGLYWGKAPLMDAEYLAGQYAATLMKIGRITDMASTKALLAAPEQAFDDRMNLVWDTDRPLYVDRADAATFDKNKFGWIEPPGMNIIEPNLAVLDKLEKDIYAAFGLTKIIYGDTGNIRDTGEPGLARMNLMMEFTVTRYQKMFGNFMGDAFNVAREFAREWLDYDDLPEEYEPLDFSWPNFAPLSELEKAQEVSAKVALGLPKSKGLEEMGYSNAADLLQEQAEEEAGNLLAHSPYDDNDPDPEIEKRINELLD